MNHSDILLPFALAPAELGADLQRALTAPALAMLLSRAATRTVRELDGFARAQPHEAWLAEQSGLAMLGWPDSSPPLANLVRTVCSLPPEAGTWFLVSPVQLLVTRDHLVLADRRQLDLSDADSRALFETALPLFEEFGHTLRYATANTWLLRADMWEGLSTATPDAACGHNIDIWTPKGDFERSWRKLQNEIHMAWHDHPVNQGREQRSQKPVNSLWLWAGTLPAKAAAANGAGSGAAFSPATASAGGRPADTDKLPGWSSALARLALAPDAPSAITWADAILAPAAQDLWSDGCLSGPAMAADWGTWLQHMHRLEAEVFAPALEALKAGRIASLSLVLTDSARIVEYQVRKRPLSRFWIKPTLASLFQ